VAAGAVAASLLVRRRRRGGGPAAACRAHKCWRTVASAGGGSNSVISLTEATVRRGGNDILFDVDLELPRGARAVLVGANGCGKTTLLTTIAENDGVDEGSLVINTESIGWLRQEAVAGSTRNVLEEAVSQMEAAKAMEAVRITLEDLANSEGKSAAVMEAAQQAYDEASTIFEAAGGYGYEERAKEVLTGLSFKPADFDKPISELSGGWQMKVGLARTLLSDPALLLLDEPSNHMDLSAKQWLANHLGNGLSPKTTLLMVTHDRSLLENVKTTAVLEIAAKRILQYNVPGILEWENNRKMRTEKLQFEITKMKGEIKKNEDYISKWGAKTAFATLAQARMKKNEKMRVTVFDMEAQLRGLPEKSGMMDGNSEGTLPLAAGGKVVLKLPDSPLETEKPPGGLLLALDEATVGYDGRMVLDDVKLDFVQGSRMALLGPNGCGKSTLLKTLAGDIEQPKGTRKLGTGGLRKAKVRLFSQDLAQALPMDSTPIDFLMQDASSGLSEQEARAALGALGLKASQHKSLISLLSGGEKARVALALFATRPADVLLLDEPTNHLDGAAVTALALGLKNHTGSVIVASHDAAFVEALGVTNTIEVIKGDLGRPGSVKVHKGYIKQVAQVGTGAASHEEEAKESAPAVAAPAAKVAVAPAAAAPAAKVATAPANAAAAKKAATAPAAAAPAKKAATAQATAVLPKLFKAVDEKKRWIMMTKKQLAKMETGISAKEQEVADASEKMSASYNEAAYQAHQALVAELDGLMVEWELLGAVCEATAAA